MRGSGPDSEVRGLRFDSRLGHVNFSHSMKPWVFRLCVVSAVAFSERVGLTTISSPEAAMTKVVEHRIK